MDVSRDAEAVAKALAEAEEGSGPVFMLVNCAGQAVCGKIEDMSVDEFKVSSLCMHTFINKYIV